MNQKRVSFGSELEKSIGFSRACRIDDYIAVSGTAPIKNGKTIHIGDVYQQTKYCLALSLKALEAAGGNINNVIRTRIMLTDIATWQDAAKAHGELFKNINPACTFVQVSGFIDKQWLVETEMDGVVSMSPQCSPSQI